MSTILDIFDAAKLKNVVIEVNSAEEKLKVLCTLAYILCVKPCRASITSCINAISADRNCNTSYGARYVYCNRYDDHKC